MSGIKIVSQIFKILFQSVVMRANALKWNFRSSLFLKKRLWHRCFPVNFVKISKNTFLHRTPLVAASKSWRPDYLFYKTPPSECFHTEMFIHSNVQYKQHVFISLFRYLKIDLSRIVETPLRTTIRYRKIRKLYIYWIFYYYIIKNLCWFLQNNAFSGLHYFD